MNLVPPLLAENQKSYNTKDLITEELLLLINVLGQPSSNDLRSSYVCDNDSQVSQFNLCHFTANKRACQHNNIIFATVLHHFGGKPNTSDIRAVQ